MGRTVKKISDTEVEITTSQEFKYRMTLDELEEITGRLEKDLENIKDMKKLLA